MDTAVVQDTLRIYYVGHAVGRETYELRSAAAGKQLTADLAYRDRGRPTHVRDTVALGPDWGVRSLRVFRLSDTSARLDAQVTVRHNEAAVASHGARDTATVMLAAPAFAIAGDLPVSQHLALVEYWLRHGRPARLPVVPGGPVNTVLVRAMGTDTVSAPGSPRVVLDRYAVDGVVWGAETVWLDGARLAGFATAGGGGLGMEAVRESLAAAYDQLMASATRDRMADLRRLTARVSPVANASGAAAVALVGGTLVDVTSRGAITRATVVIRDGKILAAGRSRAVTIPAGARRIDVHGQTIAPGLWDMHAHLMQAEWEPVYLAAGITTVRDMGNELPFTLALRRTVDSAGALGPRILLAGLVDGGGPDAFGAVSATTPDEGRKVVRLYHADGFQMMKLYDLLQPDVVGAIAAEAHSLGMTVTGHVPRALPVLAAVDSGMDHIAHLPIRGDPASDSVRQLVDSLAAHHTVMDPTVSWGELGSHSTAEPVSHFQPGLTHLPPVLAQRIAQMGLATIDTATAHARLRRTLTIIAMLHRAGVPIVAGTDEGVPGYSVYRDLELFVQAGMTPLEALRSATIVSARAMRIDGEVGTVEPGKRADLVVLAGNPLNDIANVATVRLVMKRGVLFRRADICKETGFTP